MQAPIVPPADTKFTRRLTAVIFACFVASVVVAGVSINWRTIPELLSKINWYLFPLIIVSTVASYWAAGLSFVHACRIFSFKSPTKLIWKVGFLSTIADNIAMFGNVGGHSVRLLLLSKFEHKKSQILAVSFFAGYFYQIIFIALFPLSFILLALDRRTPPFGAVTLWLLALLFIALSVILTVMIFIAGVRAKLVDWTTRAVHSVLHKDARPFLEAMNVALAEGIADSRARPAQLYKLIGWTLVDWLMDVCTVELCLLTLGSFINPGGLLLGFVVGVSLGMLSFLPGGIGVQDGSMIGIYTLLGVPVRTSVLAVILGRIVYSFVPYFVSLFVYNDVVREAAGRKAAGRR